MLRDHELPVGRKRPNRYPADARTAGRIGCGIERQPEPGGLPANPRPDFGRMLAGRRPQSADLRNSQPAAPPAMVGITRNSQTCANALPATKTAGPRLRAGLTASPVTLMNGECSAYRVG